MTRQRSEVKLDKFIVKTSSSKIQIDGDEVLKVFDALSSGGIIMLRQGAFNPSFFDSIVPDTERIKEIKDMMAVVDKQNALVGKKAGDLEFEPKEYKEEMLQLPDLFADVRQILANEEGKTLDDVSFKTPKQLK